MTNVFTEAVFVTEVRKHLMPTKQDDLSIIRSHNGMCLSRKQDSVIKICRHVPSMLPQVQSPHTNILTHAHMRLGVWRDTWHTAGCGALGMGIQTPVLCITLFQLNQHFIPFKPAFTILLLYVFKTRS